MGSSAPQTPLPLQDAMQGATAAQKTGTLQHTADTKRKQERVVTFTMTRSNCETVCPRFLAMGDSHMSSILNLPLDDDSMVCTQRLNS